MIVGIGCDLVDHDVTNDLGWASDSQMLLRLFSQKEIDIYNTKRTIKFLAGRFAAKEAVLKCLGTGMHDGISLTDIEILQLENGKPLLEVSGKVKEISDQIGINAWHVSITHSKTYSSAFVIAERSEIGKL
ncbi:MAG: holo-ACP synthase [Nitrososphaera sp.]